ncbi:MAG: HEAT repeat domain-containing protein [Aeromicrobium sp.]
MSARDEWADALRHVPPEGLEAFLTERSGLPGHRANLELADAFATVADQSMILRFANLDDEYLRFCGTEALGVLLTEGGMDDGVVGLARRRASDDLWRVREGAARALQLVGDTRPDRFRSIVDRWTTDEDSYVRRAALAAVCEPRLLTDAATRATALRACSTSTDWIASLPADRRSDPAVRNLRQALGYCWSVVVAADPATCLPIFDAVRAADDPDVRWIVRSNLTKARLRRALDRARPARGTPSGARPGR